MPVRAIQIDRAPHPVERELVEHDEVRAGRERLGELIQVLCLDLDRYRIRQRARGGDRGGDRAGGENVVFLDEHAVVEAEPVVLRAAAAHRVFLSETQAGQCLAGVEDPAAGPGDGIGVGACGGRGAREQLQEVQGRPLAREQCPRTQFQPAEHLARGDASAIGRGPVDARMRIEPAEHGLDVRAACEHGVLARHDAGAGRFVRHQQRSDVAWTDVLGEGAGDSVLEVPGRLDHRRLTAVLRPSVAYLTLRLRGRRDCSGSHPVSPPGRSSPVR